jgi:hypothetical protein
MKAATSLLTAALLAALQAGSLSSAHADGMRTYDSYDRFYATLPDPLFAATDERTLGDVQSVDDKPWRSWTGPSGGSRAKAGATPHTIEMLGPDISVDRRALPFSSSRAFPGETAADVGPDARLYVNGLDACIQGVAPSSSGTAQRHVHVRLVTDAFTRQARRYDLPALFGSCLALRRGQQPGELLFFEAKYRPAAGGQQPEGVQFEQWSIRRGQFVKTDKSVETAFPDPSNVYRFNILDR